MLFGRALSPKILVKEGNMPNSVKGVQVLDWSWVACHAEMLDSYSFNLVANLFLPHLVMTSYHYEGLA